MNQKHEETVLVELVYYLFRLIFILISFIFSSLKVSFLFVRQVPKYISIVIEITNVAH